MTCSLNEVERICQKAAEGAGASAGLDTDAAHGAAWLEARDLPALADLARDLTRFPDLAAACRFEPESVRTETLEAGDKAGAVIAPMLVDLLVARTAADGAPGALRVGGLTAPLFLLPPAARYATEGWRFRLSLVADGVPSWAFRVAAGGAAEILAEGGCQVADHFEDGHAWSLDAACARVPAVFEDDAHPGLNIICDADRLAAAAARSLAEGVAPDPEAWNRLKVLAAKVLVPASEQSRLMGAGALSSDNE